MEEKNEMRIIIKEKKDYVQFRDLICYTEKQQQKKDILLCTTLAIFISLNMPLALM